jgi:hypothetical protein
MPLTGLISFHNRTQELARYIVVIGHERAR